MKLIGPVRSFAHYARWLPLVTLLVIAAIWSFNQLRTWQINRHGEAERQRVHRKIRDAGIPTDYSEYRQHMELPTLGDWRKARHDLTDLSDPMAFNAAEAHRAAGRVAAIGALMDVAPLDERLVGHWSLAPPQALWLEDASPLKAAVADRQLELNLVRQAGANSHIDFFIWELKHLGRGVRGWLTINSMTDGPRQAAVLSHIESVYLQTKGEGDAALAAAVRTLRFAEAAATLPPTEAQDAAAQSARDYAANDVLSCLVRTEPTRDQLLQARAALADEARRYQVHHVLRNAITREAALLSRPDELFMFNAMRSARQLNGPSPRWGDNETITLDGRIINLPDETAGLLDWLTQAIAWLGSKFGQNWEPPTRRELTQSEIHKGLQRQLVFRRTENANRIGLLKLHIAEQLEPLVDAYLAIVGKPPHKVITFVNAPANREARFAWPLIHSTETLARLRLSIVAIDVELHRLEHGRWPDDPQASIRDWPIDPFDGQPLRYARTEGTFHIYSIGNDLMDSGLHEPLIAVLPLPEHRKVFEPPDPDSDDVR